MRPSEARIRPNARYCKLACYNAEARRAAHKPYKVSAATKRKMSETSKRTAPRGPQHHNWKPPRVHACEQCRKSFTVARKNTTHSGRFCSTKCWYEWLRADPTRHSSWRGGYQPYYGPNWREQARRARERDGHRCRDCGAASKQALDVHHIRPRRLFSSWLKANRLRNLRTLCKSCHSKQR